MKNLKCIFVFKTGLMNIGMKNESSKPKSNSNRVKKTKKKKK